MMKKLNSKKTTNRSVGTLAILISTFFIQNTSYAEKANSMSNQVAEIITFKLADGVKEQDFVKAGEATTTFLSNRNGFISRKLTRSKDGTYTDYVMWNTIVDAEAAMAASMSETSLVPFMQSIDPQTIKLDHQEVISTVN